MRANIAEALPLKAGVNTLGGNPLPYSRDGSRLLYYHNGADAPNDAWVYDIASKQSQQVTHSLVAGLRSADMVEPNLGALSQPRWQMEYLGARVRA